MADQTPDGSAVAPRPGVGGFVARLLIAGLMISIALALWGIRDLLAIAFGALVLAVGFRGMADALSRRTGLPSALALLGAVLVCLAVTAATFEVFGAAVASQYGELSAKLPQSARSLAQAIGRSPLGATLLSEGRTVLRAGVNGSAAGFAVRAIALMAQGLTYALIMIAAGVLLAMDPARYRDGVLRLVPKSKRDRYREVLGDLADVLRRWLMGRIVVMVAVGVLASLGLWALGIDAPFALGLTGAVLTFIPNVGSIASALPGMLIAFLQEPIKALAVAAMFWFVHFIEGTFITPWVQDETVDIPPALSIFSSVVFALLLGAVGVILTGPLTVVLMVLIEKLYVEDVLGEAPAARSAARRRGWLRRLVGAR